VLLDWLLVILARGCRAKNPVFFPIQSLVSGFLARTRHARGNDTYNRAAKESLYLFCVGFNSDRMTYKFAETHQDESVRRLEYIYSAV
jgi:hypothetical protein